MWKQGRQSGHDRYVTPLYPAGCFGGAFLGGAESPPEGPGTRRAPEENGFLATIY